MNFSNKHVFGLLCVGVLILWFMAGPTGSWSIGFWILAIIALGSFYSGFCTEAGPAHKAYMGAISGIFILGTIGVSGRISVDQSASDNVAKFIKPYPNVVATKAVTTYMGGAQGWVLTTKDKSTQVREFYDNPANYPGWEKSNQISRIIIQNDSHHIEIALQEDKKETHITYIIRLKSESA